MESKRPASPQEAPSKDEGIRDILIDRSRLMGLVSSSLTLEAQMNNYIPFNVSWVLTEVSQSEENPDIFVGKIKIVEERVH